MVEISDEHRSKVWGETAETRVAESSCLLILRASWGEVVCVGFRRKDSRWHTPGADRRINFGTTGKRKDGRKGSLSLKLIDQGLDTLGHLEWKAAGVRIWGIPL